MIILNDGYKKTISLFGQQARMMKIDFYKTYNIFYD